MFTANILSLISEYDGNVAHKKIDYDKDKFICPTLTNVELIC